MPLWVKMLEAYQSIFFWLLVSFNKVKYLAVERSVGDILKEVDEIYLQQKAALAVEDNIKLMSDYKSPRSPRSAGGGDLVVNRLVVKRIKCFQDFNTTLKKNLRIYR